MNYEARKLYKIRNRITGEEIVVGADSAQEACKTLGWMIGNCHVRVVLDPASSPGETIHQN